MGLPEHATALLAALPRCSGGVGNDPTAHCRTGSRLLATWAANGETGTAVCDEHHAQGWGDEELPWAAAARALAAAARDAPPHAVALSGDVALALDVLAAKDGATRSAVVERLMLDALARRTATKP